MDMSSQSSWPLTATKPLFYSEKCNLLQALTFRQCLDEKSWELWLQNGAHENVDTNIYTFLNAKDKKKLPADTYKVH